MTRLATLSVVISYKLISLATFQPHTISEI